MDDFVLWTLLADHACSEKIKQTDAFKLQAVIKKHRKFNGTPANLLLQRGFYKLCKQFELVSEFFIFEPQNNYVDLLTLLSD